jgi:hypothetical protein
VYVARQKEKKKSTSFPESHTAFRGRPHTLMRTVDDVHEAALALLTCYFPPSPPPFLLDEHFALLSHSSRLSDSLHGLFFPPFLRLFAAQLRIAADCI